MNVEALKKLEAAVILEDRVKIPSPKSPRSEARIMGYVEGYVVMRHPNSIPFLMLKTALIAHIRALIAQAEKGGQE